MPPNSRRDFLRTTATVTTAVLAGCATDEPLDPADTDVTTGSGVQCSEVLEGGTYLDDVAFLGEGPATEQVAGVGLDARQCTDLRKVEFDDLCVSNKRFYVRTAASELLPEEAGWQILFNGLVGSERTVGIQELRDRTQDMGKILLECSGNGGGCGFGLMSVASWAGVPLLDLLDETDILPSATHVKVRGFDTYPNEASSSSAGASWVFSLEQIAEFQPFLATEMNEKPLPRNHGQPVRLLMPRWYGCTNIKWVEEITLVDASELSTTHMREFASRTHQTGQPELAVDYRPASQDQAAMPVRVEKWQDADGAIVYRVLGILWGGYETTEKLQIRFGTGNGGWQDIDVCPVHSQNLYWSVWEHLWRPTETGTFTIECKIKDPSIPTIRLDQGFYLRSVDIDEV